MGNVDTKLTFRKAIVQLGNKNQVNVRSSVDATVQVRRYNNKGYRFFNRTLDPRNNYRKTTTVEL